MKLSELAKVIHGKLQGADANFQRISTDTRTIKADEVFFAIHGDAFGGQLDGHDFVSDIKHAAAAVVAREVNTKLPSILVKDTLQALADYASFIRSQMKVPVIALTGSCGKTSTKNMLKAIFSEVGKVLATNSSFNNAVGLPLTLNHFQGDENFVVLEIGTNAPGEIKYLSAIAKPDVALITNIAASHLAGFKNEAGVAEEKADIYRALGANGIAVINLDNPFAKKFIAMVKNKITFGLDQTADVRASNIRLNAALQASFSLVTPQGNALIQLQVVGQHQVENALAAAACAIALRVDLAAIKQGLEKSQAEAKRMIHLKLKNGAQILNDSYNANPLSTKAAIEVLAKFPGRKIMVFGDMGELGENAADFHQMIGKKLKASQVDRLFVLGELTKNTLQAFGENGAHFTSHQAIATAVKPLLDDHTMLLVKGSHSMKMWQVVDQLIGDETCCCG